jgi:hypothetical protein
MNIHIKDKYNYIFEDPNHKIPKHLIIEYDGTDNKKYTMIYKENEFVNLTNIKSLTSAKYGADDKWNDVMSILMKTKTKTNKIEPINKSSKSIALIFYGITRSLKYTINSIETNILDVLKKNNINYTIYQHTYKVNDYNNIRNNEKKQNLDYTEYTLLNPDYLTIDTQDIVKLKLDLNKYKSHKDPWNTNYNSVENYIFGMYSKFKATNMVTDNKTTYDYYMFIRPDCYYYQPFDINFLNKVTNNEICIPNFHLHSKYKINDRFSLCNKYTYKLYGTIFEKLYGLSKTNSLHSETMLGMILENKVKINRINFKFSRINLYGKIHRFDKFDDINTKLLSNVKNNLKYIEEHININELKWN